MLSSQRRTAGAVPTEGIVDRTGAGIGASVLSARAIAANAAGRRRWRTLAHEHRAVALQRRVGVLAGDPLVDLRRHLRRARNRRQRPRRAGGCRGCQATGTGERIGETRRGTGCERRGLQRHTGRRAHRGRRCDRRDTDTHQGLDRPMRARDRDPLTLTLTACIGAGAPTIPVSRSGRQRGVGRAIRPRRQDRVDAGHLEDADRRAAGAAGLGDHHRAGGHAPPPKVVRKSTRAVQVPVVHPITSARPRRRSHSSSSCTSTRRPSPVGGGRDQHGEPSASRAARRAARAAPSTAPPSAGTRRPEFLAQQRQIAAPRATIRTSRLPPNHSGRSAPTPTGRRPPGRPARSRRRGVGAGSAPATARPLPLGVNECPRRRGSENGRPRRAGTQRMQLGRGPRCMRSAGRPVRTRRCQGMSPSELS